MLTYLFWILSTKEDLQPHLLFIPSAISFYDCLCPSLQQLASTSEGILRQGK